MLRGKFVEQLSEKRRGSHEKRKVLGGLNLVERWLLVVVSPHETHTFPRDSRHSD